MKFLKEDYEDQIQHCKETGDFLITFTNDKPDYNADDDDLIPYLKRVILQDGIKVLWYPRIYLPEIEGREIEIYIPDSCKEIHGYFIEPTDTVYKISAPNTLVVYDSSYDEAEVWMSKLIIREVRTKSTIIFPTPTKLLKNYCPEYQWVYDSIGRAMDLNFEVSVSNDFFKNSYRPTLTGDAKKLLTRFIPESDFENYTDYENHLWYEPVIEAVRTALEEGYIIGTANYMEDYVLGIIEEAVDPVFTNIYNEDDTLTVICNTEELLKCQVEEVWYQSDLDLKFLSLLGENYHFIEPYNGVEFDDEAFNDKLEEELSNYIDNTDVELESLNEKNDEVQPWINKYSEELFDKTINISQYPELSDFINDNDVNEPEDKKRWLAISIDKPLKNQTHQIKILCCEGNVYKIAVLINKDANKFMNMLSEIVFGKDIELESFDYANYDEKKTPAKVKELINAFYNAGRNDMIVDTDEEDNQTWIRLDCENKNGPDYLSSSGYDVIVIKNDHPDNVLFYPGDVSVEPRGKLPISHLYDFYNLSQGKDVELEGLNFKFIEDFTTPDHLLKHYNKHVLGKIVDDDKRVYTPLGASKYNSPKQYEQKANQLTMTPIDHDRVVGFARYIRANSLYTFYKYDKIDKLLVAYNMQPDGSPWIITMYKADKSDYNTIKNRNFRMQKQGLCKVLHISPEVEEAAKKVSKNYLQTKEDVLI